MASVVTPISSEGRPMVKKWIFAAGAGIGYVLGTRAGRQRYEQMMAKAREVLDKPEVQEAKRTVQTEANRLYGEGRQLVRDKMRHIRERSEDTNGRDLESTPSYSTGTATATPSLTPASTSPTSLPGSDLR
jgi:hypothetical protein